MQEENISEKFHGWIGVDLDGTLAYYDVWHGPEHIGEPIAYMVQRVRVWLEEGRDVRIFTARVGHDNTAPRMLQAQISMMAIMNWCLQNFGQILPVTCTKDFQMVELWDDRCVQLLPNTGLRQDAKAVSDFLRDKNSQ
jgi:hypothetical protein